jgi:hypothetical protein
MRDIKKDDTGDLLPRLWEEIERGWNAGRDHELVHRLAAEHPELAEALYEFFADVVQGADDLGRVRPEYAAHDRKVREYLEREGYQRAASAAFAAPPTETPASGNKEETPTASQSPTFLALLRKRTGKSVDSLAAALDVTPDFLVVLSENGPILPPQARRELARRAMEIHSLNESDLLTSFSIAPRPMQRAASRRKAFISKGITYAVLVNSSGLDPAQKKFWLTLVS